LPVSRASGLRKASGTRPFRHTSRLCDAKAFRFVMLTRLEQLIELARKHQMADAERDVQLRSFAYGNAHLDNSALTRADVDRAVDSLIAGNARIRNSERTGPE
jgi:hypothetical protein